MRAFVPTIKRLLGIGGGPNQSAMKVAVIRQYGSASPTLRPAVPRILVNRVPLPYWQESGWREEAGGTYQGHYQTRFGRWEGHITVSPSGRVEVFIHNPPSALKRHPHWNCFNKRNDGWFFVHPVTPIADVSAGILNLEKTITEAYEI